MSYAVIGAGAVGTLLAVTLARTGNQVVLISHANGADRILRRRVHIEPATRDHPESVRYSIVHESKPAAGETTVLCVKAHQIAAAVAEHAPLFTGAETVVVVQGGIPWWYFFAAPGPHVDRPIAAVDPDGRIARAIAKTSIVGGVIETSIVHGPGAMHAGSVIRLELGEIDNVIRPRTQKLAEAFTAGLVHAEATAHIRTAIWRKFVSDVALQPLSALTRSTPAELCADPVVRGKLADAIREALVLATSYGARLEETVEGHVALLGRSNHITPMLRDVLLNRPLELDVLTGAALELAQVSGVAVGSLLELDALTRMLDRGLHAHRTDGQGVV